MGMQFVNFQMFAKPFGKWFQMGWTDAKLLHSLLVHGCICDRTYSTYRNDGNNQICVPCVFHANRNQYAWWHKSSPLLRKILLSTMYLNLFFSVGEKQTPPPTRLHLGICTIHQLADHSVAWLIDCYRRVGVNNHLRTTPSIFTSLRNYQCQNQCFIPFSSGRMKILHSFWI